MKCTVFIALACCIMQILMGKNMIVLHCSRFYLSRFFLFFFLVEKKLLFIKEKVEWQSVLKGKGVYCVLLMHNLRFAFWIDLHDGNYSYNATRVNGIIMNKIWIFRDYFRLLNSASRSMAASLITLRLKAVWIYRSC